MELNDRIYELSVQANLDGQEIKVKRNGAEIMAGDKNVLAKHIFKNLKLETGKIRGFSILEYYVVKDGFLVDKEDNQINFATERFPEIKINRIKVPFLAYDEVDVTKEWVRDTGKLLGLVETEETVKGLSDEDKKALAGEREAVLAEQKAEEARIKAEEDERAAEQARKDEEEAKTKAEIEAAAEATRLAEEEAKKSEDAKIQAEKEAEEAKIAQDKAEKEAKEAQEEADRKAEEARLKKEEEEKEYVISEKDYQKAVRRSTKLGMTEYKKDFYHFFFAPETTLPKDEYPFMLKKRADGRYEELEGGIVSESETEVEFEFTDSGDKTLILDIDNEEITID